MGKQSHDIIRRFNSAMCEHEANLRHIAESLPKDSPIVLSLQQTKQKLEDAWNALRRDNWGYQ